MKIEKSDVMFLSFAFTGQDQPVIEHRMKNIYKILVEGIKAHYDLYDCNRKRFTRLYKFLWSIRPFSFEN